ncbi:MAG: metal-dependent hydrolase [Thermoguttaceae bacterium]|nr:metal-dependent hydrolase [Thermoguttaceae bacterium]
MQDLPYYSFKHRDYTIEGYSRGAVQTYWRIPEFHLGFDLGAQPWSFMGTPNWIISHSHMDHLAALPQYVTRRRMMKMTPPTIYLPSEAKAPAEQLLFQWQRLDRGRLPCTLVPIDPNKEIAISRNVLVKTFPAKHSIDNAMAFIVYQVKTKLKPEYLDLSGEQIRDLRLSGAEITYEVRTPIIAFTGDSRPDVLTSHPDFLSAQVLIAEMTFISLEHPLSTIHKYGHSDLADFVALKDQFKNEVVIASHFSTRYSEKQIERQVDKYLPGRLDGRLKLFI